MRRAGTTPSDSWPARPVALVLILAVTACSGGLSDGDTELVVSAAASLTDVFDEMALAFEDANRGVDVVLNLAGSSTLRSQILEGADVDVFASANTANMDQVFAEGLTREEPRIFASNRLMIAVPEGNPAGITGLDDFADPGLLVGICADGVPCGDLALETFANAGIVPEIDTREPNVRALLTKVELGELDAGITFVTDVTSTGGTVEGVPIPSEHNVIALYPIAAMGGSGSLETALEFVSFVLSDAGRSILSEYGFASP